MPRHRIPDQPHEPDSNAESTLAWIGQTSFAWPPVRLWGTAPWPAPWVLDRDQRAGAASPRGRRCALRQPGARDYQTPIGGSVLPLHVKIRDLRRTEMPIEVPLLRAPCGLGAKPRTSAVLCQGRRFAVSKATG